MKIVIVAALLVAPLAVPAVRKEIGRLLARAGRATNVRVVMAPSDRR
ncbi:MAG TPA: hypothetical protein VGD12_12275 [Blastococcus sp.]